MYTAIKNKRIIAEADTISNLIPMIAKVEISSSGVVYIDGKNRLVGYNMSKFTKDEAIRDYIDNNLNDILLAADVTIAQIVKIPKKVIKVETSDTPEFTYSDYLDKKCTFSQFYRQFVSQSTLDTIKYGLGVELLINKLKEDEHLNNIPLEKWDILAERITLKVSAKKAGIALSSSCRVCIVKEAARMLCENYNPVS